MNENELRDRIFGKKSAVILSDQKGFYVKISAKVICVPKTDSSVVFIKHHQTELKT